jgi:hypothetical protein
MNGVMIAADTYTVARPGRFTRSGKVERRHRRARVDAVSVDRLLTLQVPVARTLKLEPLARCSEPDLAGAAWLLRERDPAAASLLCTLAHCVRAHRVRCAGDLPHCTLEAALAAHEALEQEDLGYGDW